MTPDETKQVLLGCPICGRDPRLREVGYSMRAAYNGHNLFYYVMECRPFFGLVGTHVSTARKGVASKDPWYRWREDLADEWNALAMIEGEDAP